MGAAPSTKRLRSSLSVPTTRSTRLSSTVSHSRAMRAFMSVLLAHGSWPEPSSSTHCTELPDARRDVSRPTSVT